MKLDENKASSLAVALDGKLQDWDRARNPQEQVLLNCYQDIMRIPRDDDTKGTATAKADKAKGLFVGSTRNKVRSARAKINDALFGNGQLPFDTMPVNEELRKLSDVTEDILTEQLERMEFRRIMKAGVNTICSYGTGFIFGLFVRKEKITETNADNSHGYTQIIETEYEYDSPYFEHASTLDVYPDAEAKRLEDGEGVFWVTMESPLTVKSWKDKEGYFNIEGALLGASEAVMETGGDRARQRRGNVAYWYKNDRIKVARYFGKVKASLISENEADEPADGESDEMIDAVIIMAGGVIVKISESPYNACPSYRCAYEEVDNEMWAVGVAENNMPHQKTVNAAFRLFMEGKGMALLGTKSVDRSLFLPTEDFKKFPGKVYHMKPGLTPDERKTAILEHLESDVTNGWLDVIRVSEQFSDDDTAITKYTQGDDSSNLNKTASGISMIMNASSMPLKEVIQNIDTNWIEPMIEALIEWNIKYLEVETVRKIHGEEKAQLWQQIKQFGKTSFMEWKATGTSSFMQKEILTNKLRAFSEFALSNPLTAPKVDPTELLQQTWDSMEIGKESPILKDDENGGLPPQVKQQMDEMQQHIQILTQNLQKLAEENQQKDAAVIKIKQEAESNAWQQKVGSLQQQARELEQKMKEIIDSHVAQIAIAEENFKQNLSESDTTQEGDEKVEIQSILAQNQVQFEQIATGFITALTEVTQPKPRTMTMTSPSGQVYEATIN